ncbi:MAG: restriction endonuclease subunit S [Bacteroidetes bacterium]|nr:restriction endonuclease subunit S [Bacteroidota bacterium]
MSEWKTYKLSEILNLVGGGTPKTTDPEYWNGEIPWLSVVDFGNDIKKVYKTEKTITEKGLNESSTKILKKGQLIISARGTVGELAVLGRDMAFNQSCYGIYANEKTENNFLYYLLKDSIGKIKKNTHGAVFDTITKQTFDNIEVTIPENISTQHQIASILSSLDDKIELNLQMNQTLEAMAQAIFKEWFVEFKYPMSEHDLDDCGIDRIKNKKTKNPANQPIPENPVQDNGLPKGWRMGSVYDLIDVTYGFPFKSNLFNSENKGKGLIRIRDLKNNYCGFFTEEKAQEKYIINAGDIVAGMDAEFNPSIWLGKQSWLNQRLCKFSPKKANVSELFIYYTVKPLLEKSQYGKVGTTVIHLGKSDIDRYEILIPSEDVLVKYKTITQEIHKKIIVNQHQIQTLTQIRDSLLPKLMTGKISLNTI